MCFREGLLLRAAGWLGFVSLLVDRFMFACEAIAYRKFSVFFPVSMANSRDRNRDHTLHQEDDILVSRFWLVFTHFQVFEYLETQKLIISIFSWL